MIGVLSKPAEVRAVEEFFELFKTPWEFFVPGHEYDLLISTLEEIPERLNARALVVYQSRAVSLDEQLGVVADSGRRYDWVEWNGVEFPVYGDMAVLQAAGPPAVLRRRQTQEVVGCFADSNRPTVRIGYDLFHEVVFLLSEGQPPENARDSDIGSAHFAASGNYGLSRRIVCRGAAGTGGV